MTSLRQRRHPSEHQLLQQILLIITAGYVVAVTIPATATNIDFGDEMLAAHVNQSLTRIKELIEVELTADDPILREVLSHLVDPSDPRLRLLFTVLSAQIGSHPGAWQVHVSASVIELVHLAALHHEQVADYGDIRLASDGAAVRWRTNIAILAGDYLFSVASRLVSRLGPGAVRTIADTFALLVTGRMRESRGPADGEDPIKHYLQFSFEKTSCLIATGARFGAVFAGVPQDHVDRLARLGGIIGTASQISSDIKDIASHEGTRDRTGWRGSTSTLPVLLALTESGTRADRLRHLLTRPIDDNSLEEAANLVRISPGMNRAKQTLRHLAAKAEAELTGLPDTLARHAFTSLVDCAVSNHG